MRVRFDGVNPGRVSGSDWRNGVRAEAEGREQEQRRRSEQMNSIEAEVRSDQGSMARSTSVEG